MDNQQYLAIGGMVYAFVSALWVGIAFFAGGLSPTLTIVALLLVILLAATAGLKLRRIPPVNQTAAESPDSTALGKWFGIIFAAEGIAIGVGSGLLAAVGLEAWIVPWVAFVVGLHFVPLCFLLRLPADYLAAAAILLLTLATVVFAPPSGWALFISMGTALVLWLAGWGRLFLANKERV